MKKHLSGRGLVQIRLSPFVLLFEQMKWLKGVYIIVTANLFTLAAAGGGVNIGDIIVTVVTFLILLALLRKFAWGPLKSHGRS